uniref:Uncharacterized protein n=1 Tax=Solanum lycopersicum TaxID=4081 RepID=K4BEM6_SOLLC
MEDTSLVSLDFVCNFPFVMQGGYAELHEGGWRVHGVLTASRRIRDWVTKTKTSHAAFDETNSFGLMILM